MEGRSQESRSNPGATTIPGDGNPGALGGGTYTGTSLQPTIQDYENIFGPASRDIKVDDQRHKRHTRWHLPDVLRGPNPWIADRIDGLISDATNSPFTTMILPYLYIENPDQQLTWAVWSFDEGLASRVPYESAARVLTQTKKSFKAYAVRHGLAITMEHNFMMSPKGRENFNNQLRQLVGSIQYSNDLDVHIALVTAPSYAKQWNEKYNSSDKTSKQICREFVDLFGIIQKNPNGLDILIEDAKTALKLWGSQPPSFMLCNPKLSMALTMTPEKTNYVTNGIDGVKRLRQGPDLASYRGVNIIHSRCFSMETGAIPRDIMRRRVRTAEYYRVPPQPANQNWCIELYDESRDTFFTMTKAELDKHCRLDRYTDTGYNVLADHQHTFQEYLDNNIIMNPNDSYDIMWPNNNGNQWRAKLFKPQNFNLQFNIPEDWAALQQAIVQQQGAIYAQDFHLANYRDIINNMNIGFLRPNNTLAFHQAMPINATPLQASAWVFSQTALLENTLRLMWRKIDIPTDFVRDRVLPFLFGNPVNAQASYAATLNTLCPYHSVMVLGLFATLTPDLNDKEVVHDAFRTSGIHFSTLRAAIVAFMRQVFKRNTFTSRIQMGQILENTLAKAFPRLQYQDTESLFNMWPEEFANGQSVCFYANLIEDATTLGNPAVNNAYRQFNQFRYNNIDIPGREIICENDEHVLGIFFWTIHQRMWTDLNGQTQFTMWPEMLPFVVNQDQTSTDMYEYVIIRPCIEHYMLGVMLGRGGVDELGATLWGQTELSCYDDAFYGVWGMSYKYHERALVFNERNLIRLWDVCYDGYNGGKDDTVVDWTEEARNRSRPFNKAVGDLSQPFHGDSMLVMRFKVDINHPKWRPYWPSPVVFHDNYLNREPPKISPDPESVYVLQDESMRIFNNEVYREQYRAYHERMPDFSYFGLTRKPAGQASIDMETCQNALAFQGTFRVKHLPMGNVVVDTVGSSHHGADYVGVASVRSGKSNRTVTQTPVPMRIV